MIIGKGAATMKIYSFIRKNGYKHRANASKFLIP